MQNEQLDDLLLQAFETDTRGVQVDEAALASAWNGELCTARAELAREKLI